MKFYRLTVPKEPESSDDMHIYFPTGGELRTGVKAYVNAENRQYAKAAEVEIEPGKTSFIDALNGEGIRELRTYTITPRFGIKED